MTGSHGNLACQVAMVAGVFWYKQANNKPPLYTIHKKYSLPGTPGYTSNDETILQPLQPSE